jgi:hypothetical protein
VRVGDATSTRASGRHDLEGDRLRRETTPVDQRQRERAQARVEHAARRVPAMKKGSRTVAGSRAADSSSTMQHAEAPHREPHRRDQAGQRAPEDDGVPAPGRAPREREGPDATSRTGG